MISFVKHRKNDDWHFGHRICPRMLSFSLPYRVYVRPILGSSIIRSTRYTSQDGKSGEMKGRSEDSKEVRPRGGGVGGRRRRTSADRILSGGPSTAGRIWGPWGREVCKCESTFISAPRPCISWELPDALSGTNRIPAPAPAAPCRWRTHAQTAPHPLAHAHVQRARRCMRMCHRSDTPEIYEQTSLVPWANRPASYGPIQFNFENKQPPLATSVNLFRGLASSAAMRLCSDIAGVWASHM